MFDLAHIPTLETERLVLRGWRADDVEPFMAMMADAEVARFLTADQRPLDHASAWRVTAMVVGHWALRGYGLFVVEEKASGAFLGRVGAWRPEGWVGLELGWGLARGAWGRGYATEAARAAGDWMIDALALERIVSLIHVDNAPSQALANRLGMTPGVSTLHAGMPHVVWEMRREDWIAASHTR